VLWAWWFDGTPVPHTITAKGLKVGDIELAHSKQIRAFLLLPYVAVFRGEAFDSLFTTPYSKFFYSQIEWTRYISRLFAVLATFAWIWPWCFSRASRAASLSALLVLCYLVVIVPVVYPWYVPPAALFVILATALCLQDISIRQAAATASGVKWRWGVPAYAVVFVLFSILTCTFVLRHIEIHQRVAERGLREPMGRWLKQNAQSPQDTVRSECLG